MGAWSQHGEMNRTLAATLGALITTWTTFTPCFLWILVGGPHIEQLRGQERLTTTLSAVTAAIVGVVMNLAVWFGIRVLWPPGQPFDFFALALGAVAFFGMARWKWGIVRVVLGADVLGLVYRLLGAVSKVL